MSGHRNPDSGSLPIDLNADIGETTHVQDQTPDLGKRLKALLQDYIDRGRSTPERRSNGKVNS